MNQTGPIIAAIAILAGIGGASMMTLFMILRQLWRIEDSIKALERKT